MAEERRELYDRSLIKSYLYWSLFWLVISVLIGLIASIKFWAPDFLGGIPWLTFSRLRVIHVNGVAFAWWATATFGLIFYIVPQLTGRRLYHEGLARFTLYLWNIIIALSVVTLALGYNQGLEVAEMVVPIDVLIVVAFVLVAINAFGTVFKREEPQLYVSLWYILGALIWATLNYVVGNFIGYYVATGINSANVHGFYIHNTVGLLITPLGIATIYYFLPAAVRAPLYSHKLSLLGFWTIAFFYAWTGTHHYIFSAIPRWVQTVAIVMSFLLFIPVWTVVYNFFATMKGRWHLMIESAAVKFLMLGTLFYLLTCFQGPVQALRSFQRVTHFTDWVVGHAHLAIFGTFTLWVMGAIYHLWPRLTGRALWSRGLASWHFWLTVVGFSLMALTLWAVGLIEGTLMANPDIPFVDIVRPARPYWIVRSFAGGLMVAGIIIFIYNILMTSRAGEPLAKGEDS